MTEISLSELSEPSSFVIDDILDCLCSCCRGVATGASWWASLPIEKSSEWKLGSVNWILQTEWSEEVEIPRIGLHFLRNMDFTNAAIQFKLSLPRQLLHRGGNAQQSCYKDAQLDKGLARVNLSLVPRTVGVRNT